MEEKTKDYSKLYHEETAPVPQTRRSTKNLDGAHIQRRHRELSTGIDPTALSNALYSLSAAQHKAYAITTLNQHYRTVFKKNTKQAFKVYLNYIDDQNRRETYLVRTDNPVLRAVKAKLPIKGDFRFFIHNGEECEEVEEDEATLPYVEKDGAQVIYCRVFRK